jgi:glycogen operon protein
MEFISDKATAAPSWPLWGNSSPLGATVVPGGVNFSLFSRDCAGVELLLFDRVDDASPARAIQLDPKRNRTYHYWHQFVPGIGKGQVTAAVLPRRRVTTAPLP